MQTNSSRAEGFVQILILLSIGGMAGAASWTHVHDLAVSSGQPSWIGWADAVVTELLPVAAGLEMRRRKRLHSSARFPLAVLISAAGLSIAAQVAAAQFSFWGWLMAALPALGFLACVKIVVGRAKLSPAIEETPQEVNQKGSETAPELTQSEEKSPEVRPVTVRDSRPSQSKSATPGGKRTRRRIEESVQIYCQTLQSNPEATPQQVMKALGITTTRQLSNIRKAATAAQTA